MFEKLYLNNEKRVKVFLKELKSSYKNITVDQDVIELYLNLMNDFQSDFIELLEQFYVDTLYKSSYGLQIGYRVGYNIVTPNLTKVVNNEFLGKTLTQRIRKNHTERTKRQLQSVLTSGKPQEEVALNVSKRLQVSYNNALRLVTTETNRVSNEALIDTVKQNPFLEYMRFSATLDKSTSKVCQENDGKVIEKLQIKQGVNSPPLHPYCRSRVVPHEDGRETTRISRNLRTGKVEKIPYMTYKEWLQTFTE